MCNPRMIRIEVMPVGLIFAGFFQKDLLLPEDDIPAVDEKVYG